MEDDRKILPTQRQQQQQEEAAKEKARGWRTAAADRERDLREETVYCSPAWDCGKGSLV